MKKIKITPAMQSVILHKDSLLKNAGIASDDNPYYPQRIQRLINHLKSGAPFDIQFSRLLSLLSGYASSWNLCAVGNLCNLIPRESGYSEAPPKDFILNKTGSSFMWHLRMANEIIFNWNEAKSSGSPCIVDIKSLPGWSSKCHHLPISHDRQFISFYSQEDVRLVVSQLLAMALVIHYEIEKRASEILRKMYDAKQLYNYYQTGNIK